MNPVNPASESVIRPLSRRRAVPVSPTPEPTAARFSEMLEGCRLQLTQVARQLCRYNEDCVLEMVQAAVVRAFDAYMRGLFKVADSPGGWMVRILNNYFFNEYRSRTKWLVKSSVAELTCGGETGPEATHVSDIEQPGAAMLASTLDEPLERALNALPDGMRSVVFLVDVQQLSYEEAAETLRVPVGTIRSRLSRARCQLYDMLQEYARSHHLI